MVLPPLNRIRVDLLGFPLFQFLKCLEFIIIICYRCFPKLLFIYLIIRFIKLLMRLRSPCVWPYVLLHNWSARVAKLQCFLPLLSEIHWKRKRRDHDGCLYNLDLTVLHEIVYFERWLLALNEVVGLLIELEMLYLIILIILRVSPILNSNTNLLITQFPHTLLTFSPPSSYSRGILLGLYFPFPFHSFWDLKIVWFLVYIWWLIILIIFLLLFWNFFDAVVGEGDPALSFFLWRGI